MMRSARPFCLMLCCNRLQGIPACSNSSRSDTAPELPVFGLLQLSVCPIWALSFRYNALAAACSIATSESLRSRLSPNGFTCANAVCAHSRLKASTAGSVRDAFTCLCSPLADRGSFARLQQLAELGLIIIDQHS